MNEKKEYTLKRWMYWFILALAIICFYKLLDNFSGIAAWLGNLMSVLAPFIGGILIAYILYLPCRSIEQLYKSKKNRKKENFINKHARMFSIITTYILAILVLVILLNVIIPIVTTSLADLIENVPQYYNIAMEKINNLPEDHFLRSEVANEIIGNINKIDLKQYLNLERLSQYAKGIISAVNGIIDVFIAFIVSVYILSQRNKIVKFLSKLSYAIFNKETYTRISKYFNRGNEIFFKFLSSQIIDAILVGVLVSVAMMLLGVKYAILLGFMIGLFNLIPYFGAIIAIVIAVIVTALTGGIGQAAIMAVVVTILQQIDANIINPKIVGNSLEISQLLVIFAVTVGGAYFGVLGMFLGVPVVAVIKMLIEDFIEERNKIKN